jgi:hypothetical protein
MPSVGCSVSRSSFSGAFLPFEVLEREKSREGGLRGVSNAGELRQAGFRRPEVEAGELALDYAWRQPFIVRLDPELDLCLGAGIARTTG